jgi:hypothetical protein
MQMSNIQVVNLADNINAAVLKINQNFDGIVTGDIPLPTPTESGGVDTGETNNLINNYLDSSVFNDFMATFLDSNYFLSVINEDYLQQFTINTNVNDSDIQANASAIFTLESRIDNTDSGILVLSQALIQTQASLDSMVLDGIDSDLLASAIASANTSIISRIEANSDQIVSFAGIIDSVENNLLLFNSDTNERIDINTSAVSSLTSRINVNSDGLSVVVGDVTDLSLSLNQLISDGITLTPEQVTEALGGALESLTLRLDADSDKLVIEAAKVVELETGLTSQNSDLGSQITAVSTAQSSLISRTEFDSAKGTINTLTQDVVDLNNEISVTNPDGTLSTAIATAKSELTSSILATTDGDILAAVNGLETTLNAKIGTDIAAATESLEAYVDAQGNTVATWGIDLVAGDSDNPKVAGIKFGNDGDTADFAITTDTFKILPADGTGSGTAPFSVVGGVVEMSGAKVTGDLDITSSDTTGSMNIKGNLITISDGSGNPRVKLGKLS